MALAKLPPLPLVLSANELLDGAVVYRTPHGGWSLFLREAQVAHEEADARALEQVLAREETAGAVVDPFLAPIRLDGEGRATPIHYRERIRAVGPTVRQDFNPPVPEGHDHVSV